MKKIKFLVLSIGLASLIAACGDKPLTDEQKARLGETFNDISTTGDAVSKSSKNARGGVAPTAWNSVSLAQSILGSQRQLQLLPLPMKKLFGGFMGLEVDRGGLIAMDANGTPNDIPKDLQEYRLKRRTEREKKAEQMGAALATRFLDGSCSVPESDLSKVVQQSPDPTRAAEVLQSIKFRIVGENCPIFAEFRASDVKSDGNRTVGKFGFTFEVKDPAMIALSELISMKMDFEIETFVDENTMEMEVKNLEGTTKTVAEGEITYGMSFKMAATGLKSDTPVISGSSTCKMNFKDFTAKVKVEIDSNNPGNSKITLNGETKTPQELQDLFAGNQPLNGNAPAPIPNAAAPAAPFPDVQLPEGPQG